MNGADPNLIAIGRLFAGEPVARGCVKPATEVIPGFESDLILHAAPPAPWDELAASKRGART
jgi:hypothetical protein